MPEGGTVENCISRVNIQSTGDNVGGITGYNGTVNNCQNYGNLVGIEKVGGVCASGGFVTSCINYGEIKGSKDVGGIGGFVHSIINCKNYGIVSGTTNYAGGIVGRCTYRLNQCINYAKISGNDQVGGIEGDHWGRTLNCINYGNVEGNLESVGGILVVELQRIY